MYYNIAVIGSSGAIGGAFKRRLAGLYPEVTLHSFSRKPGEKSAGRLHHDVIDYADENSIEKAAAQASRDQPLDLVVIATGILHTADGVQPEKSIKDISADKFEAVFAANTIFPTLAAKHFLPKINRESRSVFAVLSARVGSISDNRLGGWYAYRASKAALNMIIKNLAIETARRNKHAIIVGLHPGTVDSALSKPFQVNAGEDKLFTPDDAADKLIQVLNRLTPQDSGKCFAWDGKEILP